MKTTIPIRGICGQSLVAIALALAAACPARADYQTIILKDHPLAYYPLDLTADTTGTATDLSGNKHNGTYVNIFSGYNNVAGPSTNIPNAIAFDGASMYVDLSTGSNPGLLNFGGQITMEAWVQPANPPQNLGDILAKGYDASDNYHEMQIRANQGRFEGGTYGPDGSKGAGGGTQSSDWTHVVCTYDGTNWNFYVNGILASSSADTVGAINFAAPWAIGSGSANGGNRYFNGNICEVALYNYGLTPGQVCAHYMVGIYGSAANPIFTTQPQAQSCYPGGSAKFTSAVLSPLPATFQWSKDGVALKDQTNATLTLVNVQATDAGNYTVSAITTTGSATSSAAKLTVNSEGANLKWSGNGGNNWDTSSSGWINIANNQHTAFSISDKVTFDDTASVPTSIFVSTTVLPSFITVNSSANAFTLNGDGSIGGPASLTKLGSSTLEIQMANTFTGPVMIGGGTLKMDEPLSGVATSLGDGSGPAIIVTNGATLALNASGGYPAGNSGLDARPVVISGAGVDGKGALQSVGNDIYHDGTPNGGLARSITLAGDATIGSSGRCDIGHNGVVTTISTGGKSYNLTVLQGSYSEWRQVTIDPNLGNIDYIVSSPNTWYVEGMGKTGFGNPAGTITLHSGAAMRIGHDGNNNADNGYAKIIHVQNGASFTYQPWGGAGDYHLDTAVQLDDGAGLNFFSGNGGNNSGITIGGTVTVNGLVHIQIGDSPITFTNTISGPGGFILDNYNNTLFFTAENTYTGPTVLCNGRTLALSGKGSIATSSLLFFGGSDSTSVRLDASDRPDQTFTLSNGQTLSGIGKVKGRLVIANGATIAPAGTNTTLGITAGSSVTGTISAVSAITLNGTTVMKLNGSGNSDTIESAADITLGGVLNLVNVSSSPLAAGNSFQLFKATSCSQSFASIVPSVPGTGLVWDTSELSTGKIKVAAAPQDRAATVNSVHVSGGNLVLAGTNRIAGGTFYVLTSSNITAPLSQWKVVSTNTFDGTGAFSVSAPVSSTGTQQFYMLKTQ